MTRCIRTERMTPAGRGAVAVIRVTGDALDALDAFFRPASGRPLSKANAGQILYGHWEAEDVVVVPTGEQTWEVQCHGGEAAVAKIMRNLDGIPDSPDPPGLEDQLTHLLLQCRTTQTANFLLAQRSGIYRRFLEELVDASDEAEIRRRVDEFLQWESFAGHLTEPWRVAVIGQPNAGKSSLMNAILGYERAIVFDQPGTTRDTLEAEVIIDNWPYAFTDTAGLRDRTDDAIEAAGMTAAKLKITTADVCVLVVDSATGWTSQEMSLFDNIPKSCRTIIAWNKSDLPESLQAPSVSAGVVQTSATAGTGISELLRSVSEATVPGTPAPNRALPVLPHINEILKAYRANEDLQELRRELRSQLEQ